MSIARAMMLHAAIHWPQVADPQLWPMAVKQAIYLWNHMPVESTGISPHDLYTSSRWAQSKFQDVHVWGCPFLRARSPSLGWEQAAALERPLPACTRYCVWYLVLYSYQYYCTGVS
jgi:hypothetical protein